MSIRLTQNPPSAPMRLARLAAVLIAACVLAPLAVAQSEPSGILVAQSPPALTYDAGLGPRAAPSEASVEIVFPADAAGPRGRGAWRGAKRGFLVGLGISAVAVAGTMVHDAQDGGCDMFCPWMFVAAAAVPFTAITTATGAVIGAATARPEAVPPPVLE